MFVLKLQRVLWGLDVILLILGAPSVLQLVLNVLRQKMATMYVHTAVGNGKEKMLQQTL